MSRKSVERGKAWERQVRRDVAGRLVRLEPDRPDPVLEEERRQDEWAERERREVWGE